MPTPTGQTAAAPPDLRALRPDELEGALTLLTLVFGRAPAAEDVEVELAVVDPRRFYGASAALRCRQVF